MGARLIELEQLGSRSQSCPLDGAALLLSFTLSLSLSPCSLAHESTAFCRRKEEEERQEEGEIFVFRLFFLLRAPLDGMHN